MGAVVDAAGLVATVAVCILALIFGDLRERRGVVLCLMWQVIVVAAAWFRLDEAWAHFTADGLCLIGFVILGWKAPYPWPLWAGGFEMAALALMINRLSGYPAAPEAYVTLSAICAGGVLASLAIGTFRVKTASRL